MKLCYCGTLILASVDREATTETWDSVLPSNHGFKIWTALDVGYTFRSRGKIHHSNNSNYQNGYGDALELTN